jgi:protein SCO1/2
MLSKNYSRLAKISALFTLALAVPFISQIAAADDPNGHFPNIELITQDGKTVHFYDDLIKGKIVAIDFVYTSCQYGCPLETARMAQVQKKLGDRVGGDIFFYSISIDPDNDTPKVLKAYMEKFHIGPGWKKDIDFLSKRLGVYSNPSINADGHLPHLLIGNEATGTWIRANALDNPSFQARMIGEFLDNFKHTDFKAEQQKKTGDGGVISNFDRGKYLFARDCVACHTMGQGDKVGPDLLGVTAVRDHDWLAKMIQHPEQLLNENDPIATAMLKKYNNVRMPNVSVNNDELGLLLRYFETATAARDKEATAGANAIATKPADAKTGTTHPNR